MGKKRKRPKKKTLKNILCVFMCALVFFQTAEPSAGAAKGRDAGDIAVMAASESIDVNASINMPYTAYEGHIVLLSDASEYTVDGARANMKELYDDGSVRVEFTVTDDEKSEFVDIKRGKCEKYQRNAVFKKPGGYEIEMRLYVGDNYEYAVKQRINIDKAPETTSVTAGAKKQNRLQRIEFKTAQNPGYPVQSLKLEISADRGSENIAVDMLDGSENRGKVFKTDHIIARKAECSVSEDKCFLNGSVEFMSVFEADTDFSYKITAVDTRGNSHTFDDDLIVRTDKEPVAAIDMSSSYTREEKCRYAVVTAEDVSQSDGDSLKREWFVRYEGEAEYRPVSGEPGYTDLSDGSAARISFRKEGTGKFYVKLTVVDIWSEGTMDEYTSKCERLSDHTEKTCEVTNIAPRVFIGAHKLKSADIVVISDNDSDDKQIRESFFEKFMSEGVQSHVTSETVDVSRLSQVKDDISEQFQHRGDYGYNGASTAFERELYAVDNSNMYCMDAVWSDPDKGYPEEPFTLTAFNAETGDTVWSYIITSEVFKIDIRSAHMYQDDSEKYLYIVSDGKTLVMSKRSGVPVTVIDYELGEYNYAGHDVIYTYCGSGVYSVSLTDGSVSKIWKGKLSGASRRLNGLVNTYYRTPQGSVMKLLLDVSSGEISEKYIGKLDSKLFREENKKINSELLLNVAGIDADGTAVLAVSTPVYNENINSSLYNYKLAIQVYDKEGRLLKQQMRTNGYSMKAVPVCDGMGRYNYAAISYEGHDVVSVEVFGINDDVSCKTQISNKYGDPAVYDQIIYAVEDDGNVDITLGGLCTWIYNQTWGNGPSHGYPERCSNLIFDMKNGIAGRSTLKAGCSSFSEYARSSDMYTVIRIGRNSQYVGTAALDNTVVKHPRTAYEMLYRVFNRNIRSGSDADHKILIIKNDEIFASMSEDQKSSLLKKASENGYSIYFTGAYEESGAGDGGGIVYLNENDDYIARIVELENKSESASGGRVYSSVTVENESGYIERELTLDENKEYFYEYTLKSDNGQKENAELLHSILPILPQDTYGNGSFSVYDYEIEDFDDDDINSFFSFENYESAGGLYTDCYASHTGSGNVGVDRSSVISFNIPKGKKGVISFDYIIVNNKSAGKINSNYAEIDGQRWEETPGKTGNGRYTHPYILESGEHKLKLYTGGYGGKMITYTYIDDLKLSYVREGEADTNAFSDQSVSQRSENVYKISGSFKTPGNVTSYKEMKGVDHLSGQPGDVIYTELANEEDAQNLYIKIPEGKKAVGSTVRLNSYTKSGYSVSYSMDEFVSGSHHGSIKSFNYALSHIPADWVYSIPTFSGNRTFRVNFNSYRGTRGSFSDLEMYTVDDTNQLIERHNYLKAGDGSGKTLFLGEDMYGGKTAFRLKFDKGVSEIYDFYVYTIQDGRKMYAASDDFSDKEALKKWKVDGAEIKRCADGGSDNGGNDVNIFQKGQLVKYDVSYWDYEDDPSKQSFWKYTHTPSNDGAFEKADVILDNDGNIMAENGITLNEPVTRFYKDGKYTVEHWQTDDTTGGAAEGGDPAYDKESNHVFLTFYIGGIADAPWIRYIKTTPSEVYEGDAVGLEIAVDDALKQQLALETIVYDENDNAVYQKKISEISPSNGKYDTVIQNNVIPAAACGRYKVLCTLSSPYGTGADSITFNVMSFGSVNGQVRHTEKWDQNRQRAGREENVFWPGERLEIYAEVEGSPTKVTAWIEGESYKTEDWITEGNVYRSFIWNEDMMFKWTAGPVEKKVIFKAEYKGGMVKMSECSIIFDNSRLYWNIHRTQGA